MLSAKDVVKAHKVLSGVVANTPLDYDHYLSEKYGAKIYLKKENAQRVRSFKIRGAYYAISQLTKEERERGVLIAGKSSCTRPSDILDTVWSNNPNQSFTLFRIPSHLNSNGARSHINNSCTERLDNS